MPIIFVARSGPPAPMECPMVLCDVCGAPVVDGQNAFAARWVSVYRTPTLSSPVYYVHSNLQQRCLDRLEEQLDAYYREAFGGSAVLCTTSVGETLQHLAANYTHPVGDSNDIEDARAGGSGVVQYVAPVVSEDGQVPPGTRVWSAVVRDSGQVEAGMTTQPQTYSDRRSMHGI